MKPITLTEAILRCRQLLAANSDPGNTLEGLLDEDARTAIEILVEAAGVHGRPAVAVCRARDSLRYR